MNKAMAMSLIYRGYIIERIGKQWCVMVDHKPIYTAANEAAAMAWVDHKREQAWAKSRAEAAKKGKP